MHNFCGLGIGWSEDEYIASNIPYDHRASRADEFVQALTRIWTEDIVEFKGRYYEIPASKIGPKPLKDLVFQSIWQDLVLIHVQGLSNTRVDGCLLQTD
jgi:Luciferase-like monooxygenase